VHQAIDVIRRIAQVSVTPVGKFLPEHLRRELRRNARRLRQQKAQPRAAEAESGLSASLPCDFAPRRSVDDAFVAKSPGASYPGPPPPPRDERL